MGSLSIRHMNFTLQAREHERARQDAAWYAALPAEQKAERSHYWFIEKKKKTKHGKYKWIVMRGFHGTKSEAAELFVKSYRNRTDTFRLRHLMKYGA